MRWKGVPEPKDNEERSEICFAILPVQIEDGNWLWFEKHVCHSVSLGGVWHIFKRSYLVDQTSSKRSLTKT